MVHLAAVIINKHNIHISVTDIYIDQMSSNHDFIIIGMGITGCYLAYQLNRIYPERKILCLERSSRYGGRLLSVRWKSHIVDFGGWRYSSLYHREVSHLVQQFQIPTVPINTTIIHTYPSDIELHIDNVVNVIDNVNPDNITDTIGFIQYLYMKGIDHEDITHFIDSTGYNIFREDVSLDVMIDVAKNMKPYRHFQYGYISLCRNLIERMTDNVEIQLSTDIQTITDESIILKNGGNILYSQDRLFVTVQPNSLAQLYPTSILSSMVGYDAIRMYVHLDKVITPGEYISTLPLRKLFVLENRFAMIYVDGPDSRIIQTTIENNIPLINTWLYLITGEDVNIVSVIYKYWEDGIFFWRPIHNRDEIIRSLPFHYLNGDISTEPGWVNGSLSLVDSYLENRIINKV